MSPRAAAPRGCSPAAAVLLPCPRCAQKEEGQPAEPPGLPGIVSPFLGEVAAVLFSSVLNLAEG